MTYTGDVTQGGPADVREIGALRLHKVSVGPMDNNAYLLECTAGGERLLVDAAAEPETLLGLLPDGRLEQVVTTHRHADHWQGLAEVVARTGTRTLAGRPDVDAVPVATDQPLDDGDRIRVGQVELEVISLVGHTPGSIALLYDDQAGQPHLFTGDSLFPGGVGKTPDAAAFTSLLDDVEHKLFGRLPDDTWVYPGHGKDSTLGVERASIPQWRARGW